MYHRSGHSPQPCARSFIRAQGRRFDVTEENKSTVIRRFGVGLVIDSVSGVVLTDRYTATCQSSFLACCHMCHGQKTGPFSRGFIEDGHPPGRFLFHHRDSCILGAHGPNQTSCLTMAHRFVTCPVCSSMPLLSRARFLSRW